MKRYSLLVLAASLLAWLLLGLSCKEHTTELLTLDDPVLSHPSGNYFSGQAITVTHNELGARIYYTVNGNIPTEQDSLLFTVVSGDNTGELVIPNFFPAGADSATVRVKAFKNGMNPSGVVQGTYSVTYWQTVATPIFLPQGGNITTATEISIVSTTSGAEVHYTLDGSEPTQASPTYGDPFTINQPGTVTVKARAYKPIYNPSEIASATYTVSAK